MWAKISLEEAAPGDLVARNNKYGIDKLAIIIEDDGGLKLRDNGEPSAEPLNELDPFYDILRWKT